MDKREMISQFINYMTLDQLKEYTITLLEEKFTTIDGMQAPKTITHKSQMCDENGKSNLAPTPIRIPSPWINSINKMIRDPDYPYKSFGEFAREAIYRYLKVLEDLKNVKSTSVQEKSKV